MAQQTSEIIDRYGRSGRLKTKRIREFEAAGQGEWQAGVFVFHPRRQSEADMLAVRHSPDVGKVTSCATEQFSGCDSGFSLLPYPQPSRGPGLRFPTLARVGAGI